MTNLCTINWQETQVLQNGDTNYGADCREYALCGDPESIYQIYFSIISKMQQLKNDYYIRITYNGREVKQDGRTFKWYYKILDEKWHNQFGN